MKEHQDYMVNVKLNDSNKLTVSSYTLCNVPCSSSSSTGSSGGSSIVNVSTEPEETRETKECGIAVVDSNLQLDSHSPLVKSKIESSLPCNTISGPHQNQNFWINSLVWVNQEGF